MRGEFRIILGLFLEFHPKRAMAIVVGFWFFFHLNDSLPPLPGDRLDSKQLRLKAHLFLD